MPADRTRVPMNILGVGFCLAFWSILFVQTGLGASDFHLIDDHRLVAMYADLKASDDNLAGVLRTWLATDIGERRFRPLYIASRVLRAEFFGLSWTPWIVYNAVLAATTSAALFLFGRVIGFTLLSSLALAAWSTLGQPSTIWWRLGTPETEANCLVALTLLSFAGAVLRLQRRTFCDAAAVGLALAASLAKEGMILYLPALCAFRVWLPCWLHQTGLRTAWQDSTWVMATLGVAFIAGLGALFAIVGTAGTGYAGVDRSTWEITRIWASFQTLSQVGGLWIPAAATAIALVVRAMGWQQVPAAPLMGGWLAFLLAAVPQVLLYAKSGWAGHYFNPVIINCAWLGLLAVECLRRVAGWLFLIGLVLVIAQINPHLKSTRHHAREYAAEGVALRGLLHATDRCTVADEPVLLVANSRVHYEEAFSLRTYLARMLNRPRVYLATVGAQGSHIRSDALIRQEEARSFLDPKVLEDYYFQGRTLARLDPQQRGRLQAILILAPDRLRGDFTAASSGWFKPKDYRTESFEFPAFAVELLCGARHDG